MYITSIALVPLAPSFYALLLLLLNGSGTVGACACVCLLANNISCIARMCALSTRSTSSQQLHFSEQLIKGTSKTLHSIVYLFH